MKRRTGRAPFVAAAALLLGVLVSTAPVGAAPTAAGGTSADAVLEWNRHALVAIFNPPDGSPPGAGQPPPVGAIHLAMTQIAVFDAVNAIVGGYEPYLDDLPDTSSRASVDAAVAVAAHDVLVAIRPVVADAVRAHLDARLAASLAAIPAGGRKEAGIRIGAAAAAAILAERADDGRFGPFRFTVSEEPGAWRPTPPLFVNDPNAWVAEVDPFTLRRASQFQTAGPPDLESRRYAREFREVKALGSATSTRRSAAQTAAALYFTENPFTLFMRSFGALVGPDGKDLPGIRVARLLAMMSVSGADSLIACWESKVRWSNWRPITAIHEAAHDGNRWTIPDPTWTSLVPNPPYPDNPSGYNCASAGMVYAARAFFSRNSMRITLTNAAGVTRSYTQLGRIVDDTVDARVWAGLHFRSADTQAALLGKHVARWVSDHFFERDD